MRAVTGCALLVATIKGVVGDRVYDAEKMYGAQQAFAQADTEFVRREAPIVLDAPSATIPIEFTNISGPAVLGEAAQIRFMGSFNPSLIAAPPGLCPRCAYVVSMRVEALHQCDATSPLWRSVTTAARVSANAYYRGTAIVVLDNELNVLGYTWLITSHNQIHDQRALKRWTVPVGVSDGFAPSWGHAIYDVRLINVEGRIFATYVCHGCNFGVLVIHITADPTPDGGLRHLRAWRSQRFVSGARWAKGRNQAVFSTQRTPSSPTELFVQPWFSLVASFGVPDFFTMNVSCYKHAPLDVAAVYGYVRRGIYTCMHNERGARVSLYQIDSSADAEATAEGTPLPKLRKARRRARRREKASTSSSESSFDTVPTSNASKPQFGSSLELVANLTAQLRAIKAMGVGKHRISTTAHMVRIHDSSTGKDALLGVAHIRRGVGDCIEKQCTAVSTMRNRRGRKKTPAPAFRWGHHYTHFFYALTPHFPFEMMGVSVEFCIASKQNPQDCESVQFITGLALRGSTLLMAYGVNDCEAKIARLPISRVFELLKPLPAATGE